MLKMSFWLLHMGRSEVLLPGYIFVWVQCPDLPVESVSRTDFYFAIKYDCYHKGIKDISLDYSVVTNFFIERGEGSFL